jgi:hypothetical protein
MPGYCNPIPHKIECRQNIACSNLFLRSHLSPPCLLSALPALSSACSQLCLLSHLCLALQLLSQLCLLSLFPAFTSCLLSALSALTSVCSHFACSQAPSSACFHPCLLSHLCLRSLTSDYALSGLPVLPLPALTSAYFHLWLHTHLVCSHLYLLSPLPALTSALPHPCLHIVQASLALPHPTHSLYTLAAAHSPAWHDEVSPPGTPLHL